MNIKTKKLDISPLFICLGSPLQIPSLCDAFDLKLVTKRAAGAVARHRIYAVFEAITGSITKDYKTSIFLRDILIQNP